MQDTVNNQPEYIPGLRMERVTEELKEIKEEAVLDFGSSAAWCLSCRLWGRRCSFTTKGANLSIQ